MRNTGTRGYSGYRGRRPDGRRWLIVALVLIILAAVAFWAVQRYIVYDMGGYHFELPWRRSAENVQPEHPAVRPDLEIVIEGGDGEQPPVTQPLHAQELDVSTLQGGAARALQALPENVNAVAIRLKNSGGELLYPSTLPEALEAKAVVGSSIVGMSVRELCTSDYYTVARLSALHDSIYSFAHMTDAAVQQLAYNGYIWYAPDSTFYLAPEKELARQYLVNIAREVAALGFDEVLFDEFTYPPGGRLNNIRTEDRTMTQEEALALLADELRAALEPTGTRLSLTLDAATVLAGGNETTGQSLAALADRFDRIYVPTAEEQLPELRAALEPYTAELVPILAEPPADDVPYLLASNP